jgi:deazaflavin-dependent oxidoreductase (nitroreductase family)
VARPRPVLAFIDPFTRRVVNPLTRRFAGRLPMFGLLTHRGRKTGTIRRTPLNVFWHGGDAIVALTYGSDVQWAKNVLAAGGCELETRGRHVRLRDPELIVDPAARLVPLPVRLFLRLNRVSEFLRLRPAGDGPSPPPNA